MTLTKISQATGIEHTIEIPISVYMYNSWIESGRHIQDFFPYLSDDIREFMLTGITREERDKLFKDNEEEEESFGHWYNTKE